MWVRCAYRDGHHHRPSSSPGIPPPLLLAGITNAGLSRREGKTKMDAAKKSPDRKEKGVPSRRCIFIVSYLKGKIKRDIEHVTTSAPEVVLDEKVLFWRPETTTTRQDLYTVHRILFDAVLV